MRMDISGVKLTVIDNDHSSLSRHIASHLSATSYFTWVEGYADYTAAVRAMDGGDVDVIVQIPEDLEKNLILSKNLGFEGMLVLNPKELPLVNQYYSPSVEEAAWAEEMVQLTAEAKAEDKGVAVKDGKFIGPPMLKMAKKILAKHEMINSKSSQ